MPRQPLVRPWTREDDAELRRLSQHGLSLSTKAMRLRRSPRAVRYRERLLARETETDPSQPTVLAPEHLT